MRDRHILMTGASGFLGRHVLELLLSEGCKVICLSRRCPPVTPSGDAGTFLAADLSADFSEALSKVGEIDSVIHLAQAPGWNLFPENSGRIAAISIAATVRLAEYAISAGAKSFVLASSGGIYGPSSVPLREIDPIRPLNKLGFYLSTKAAAEEILGHFSPFIRIHCLRYFFIYGSGQTSHFLISRIHRAVVQGDKIEVAHGVGPRMNPIHVKDAARATVATLDLKESLISNVAGPDVMDLASIARRMGDLVGRPPTFENTDVEPEDYIADIETMTRFLGAPMVGLRSGLADVGAKE